MGDDQKRREVKPKGRPVDLKAQEQAIAQAKAALEAELALRRAEARSNKTIIAIFERPTRNDIRWNDIVNLVKRLKGEMKPGRGSRWRITIAGVKGNVHSPHPGSELKPYSVEDFRDLLELAGYKP